MRARRPSASIFPEMRATCASSGCLAYTATAFTAHWSCAMIGPEREGGNWMRIIAIGAMLLLLPSCAASTARKLCERQGFPAGTSEHTDCAQRLRSQWMAEGQRDLAEGLTLGVAIAGQTQAARQGSTVAAPSTVPSSQLTSYRWSPQGRLCTYANGSVLNVGTAACPQSIGASR